MRLRLGRRRIPIEEGDTIAVALHRAGVRTLSRSVKRHRRRGLYCGTGDCPSCLMTVDGVPGIRTCLTPAKVGMRVTREGGWPSTEHDLLSIADRLHALVPVGFYHKTFIRPRWAWPLAERAIRRATGLGRLPAGPPSIGRARHLRCDVLVVGGGPAGRGPPPGGGGPGGGGGGGGGPGGASGDSSRRSGSCQGRAAVAHAPAAVFVEQRSMGACSSSPRRAAKGTILRSRAPRV